MPGVERATKRRSEVGLVLVEPDQRSPEIAATLLHLELRCQSDVVLASGEHPEPPEQQLLVGTQQVVAPLDGAQQRPLAALGVAVRRREQANAFVEPIENLRRRCPG